MDSLKKSFKSHGSYNKRTRRISAGGGSQTSHEELPILSDQDIVEDRQPRLPNQMNNDSIDRSEVIVKIDEGGDSTVAGDPSKNAGKLWQETSYDAWKDPARDNVNDDDDGEGGDGHRRSFDFVQGNKQLQDPPSKLIGQFLHKQNQRSSGDMALDMDLEMDELRNHQPLAESPMNVWQSRELKVSFNPPSTSTDAIEGSQANEPTRRRCKESTDDKESHGQQGKPNHEEKEVVRCTSNASFQPELSFQRRSSLLRARTKSRLMDPPDDQDRRADRVHRSGQIPRSGQVLKSGLLPKSGQMKSGFLGKAGEDEEDDPFFDEDLPDDFTRSKLSALTLIQWASLVLIVAALACTLSVTCLREKNLWKLKLWKWEVLIAVLICGRLVSGWGIRIVVFFIERNFLLRKRVLYFVYGIRKAVQNCLWLGLVLVAWHFLFDKKVERETRSEGLKYVTKVLICFLVGTLLWLVKALIVKVLASSFHVTTYFDRIQDSLFNQFVIETLSGPPLIEIHKTEEEDERLADEVQKLQNAGATIPPDLKATAFSSGLPPRTSRVIGSGRLSKTNNSAKLSRMLSKKSQEGITIDHLHKLNPMNVSAWNMKRLMKIVRNGSLTTLDEQILDSTRDDECATQIRSEVEAKAAAKKIFLNVARRGSKYIYIEDLMRFMREDEAEKAMSLFEGATETQRISKSSLKNWVVNSFRERRALALTLNDTKTAVNKLHHMVNIIVAIVIGVIWLIVLGIATTKFLLFVSSQLVLVAFVFGNTCKTVFEAIVFLFVMHPFDVGDRCEIDGVQMVVEEMNILTTIFLRYDNTKIIFPNSTLATKAVNNFYRSPDTGDGVEFCIHVATPADKIVAMKQRITNYVESKVEHWYPAPMIIMKDLEELNRVRMAVWLCHKMNHQDMGERYSRRSLLIEEMVKTFKELDIQYRLLPIDINVCAMPTVTSTRLPNNWTPTS
ncbi:mechanosensitive ion channel protein 6-like [Humulus lupulus]|uniref:mechanosensitive ion channel protein 6-like n=1 Tax=Humulus lupulus TaxID=3486 RepID=UPI002B40ED33|nr:mechanosensitive ion channel protein 6-like [Humulus lupulus]XP_062107219.1 mechanosensitive ion channel protein 6-like [Humulus lupulus]